MDINHQINHRLQELNAENLPATVLLSIQNEVAAWEKELKESAKNQLHARIEKRITKPFVARHFSAEFKRRKPSRTPLEDGQI
jgi:hypothetical protein